MSQQFNYRERAARCAQWSNDSKNERAKEIWRQMERYWETQASKEVEADNGGSTQIAAAQLVNNLLQIKRHLGQLKEAIVKRNDLG